MEQLSLSLPDDLPGSSAFAVARPPTPESLRLRLQRLLDKMSGAEPPLWPDPKDVRLFTRLFWSTSSHLAPDEAVIWRERFEAELARKQIVSLAA